MIPVHLSQLFEEVRLQAQEPAVEGMELFASRVDLKKQFPLERACSITVADRRPRPMVTGRHDVRFFNALDTSVKHHD
jgi:hypothetical protein